MKKIKKAFVVMLLFVSIFACNIIQGMKQKPEINNRMQCLLGFLAEDLEDLAKDLEIRERKEEREKLKRQRGNDNWHADVTGAINKKAKFESALAQVQVPIMRAPIIMISSKTPLEMLASPLMSSQLVAPTRPKIPPVIIKLPQRTSSVNMLQQETPPVLAPPLILPKIVTSTIPTIEPVIVNITPQEIVSENISQKEVLQGVVPIVMPEIEPMDDEMVSQEMSSAHVPVPANKYKCGQCSFQADYFVDLARHAERYCINRKTKEIEKEYHCNKCSFQTIYFSNLKRHIKDRHS